MDIIKDSFQKVKQDIDSLKEELSLINQILQENSNQISKIGEIIKEFSLKLIELNKKNEQIYSIDTPAQKTENPTIPTDIPAHNLPLKALKEQNIGFSTGNRGVPADRQTDQQTDQHIQNPSLNDSLAILSSLDNLKKEIRHKFKRITDQEFLVFSAIYQIEEESGFADYKSLSRKLNLTESSIRDYVGKLMKKGIPIEKIKINNKIIQLSISENLKKIAPLPVILQLREL